MSVVSGIVVYICIWWLALFAVLPWGVRHSPGKDKQTGPGAPDNPHIRRKFLITTLVAGVLWILVYLAIDANLVDFREIAEKMAKKDYTG